jgi:hypothetical protein
MVWKKPFFKRVSSKKTSFVLQLFTWKSIFFLFTRVISIAGALLLIDQRALSCWLISGRSLAD